MYIYKIYIHFLILNTRHFSATKNLVIRKHPKPQRGLQHSHRHITLRNKTHSIICVTKM